MMSQYSFAEEELLVLNKKNGIWLPNTIILEGLPVYKYEGNWYFLCDGGLVEYSDNKERMNMYVLPAPHKESLSPRIVGLAKDDKTLWVAMAQYDGVSIYDLETKEFKTEKYFDGKLNFNIIPDYYNGIIWAPSFTGVSLYKLESKKITLLEDIISTKYNYSKIFPDNDYVWINQNRFYAPMVQIDYKNKKSALINNKILGIDARNNSFNLRLVSSKDYLWGYFYIANRYNFYITVYDKKNNTWKTYRHSEIVSALELLISELPYIKWSEDNFLVELKRIIEGMPKLPNDHSYKLAKEEIDDIKKAVNELISAYKRHKIDYKYLNYGMHENTIYNSTIYSKSNEWGELKAGKEIEINKVRFKQLLCKIGKNIVVETNKGIGILDIAKYTLDYLTPQNEFKGLYFMDQRLQFGVGWSGVYLNKDEKSAVIREYFTGPDDDFYEYILLDFVDKKIKRIYERNKIKEQNLEPLIYSKIPKSMSHDDLEIILRWDGLFIQR